MPSVIMMTRMMMLPDSELLQQMLCAFVCSVLQSPAELRQAPFILQDIKRR